MSQEQLSIRSNRRAQTVYFAYGSNLHLAQMAKRCPESRYLGIGKLRNYRWQINTRGFANVINSPGEEVWGLCFLLSREDERRLDRNEGVSTGAYEKSLIPIDVFPALAMIVGRRVREVDEYIYARAGSDEASDQSSSISRAVSEYHYNNGNILDALVYINRVITVEGNPREEYIARIRFGIDDALKLGISRSYFEKYVDGAMEVKQRAVDY
ncbi:AIG2 family protein [Rutstroemia sp. NJR-2017a BVV2]|nr:AIG2 family protein [Rutstroemia sp. NJR-2017a BVV2]